MSICFTYGRASRMKVSNIHLIPLNVRAPAHNLLPIARYSMRGGEHEPGPSGVEPQGAEHRRRNQ